MLGVLVNVAVVIVGSLIGLLCKKGIPDRLVTAVMTAMGLCVLYIGVQGALEGVYPLAIILSMALGAALGTLLDIDGALNRFGAWIQGLFAKRSGTVGAQRVGEAMVTATLLFCVGAMTVVGSFRAAMGDNSTLFTKSVLDFISSIVLTVSLGFGVMLSSVGVLVIEGVLVLCASFIHPLLSASCIADLTCVGSLMIVALGLNVIKAADIKVANLLPALLLSPAFTYLYELLIGLF